MGVGPRDLGAPHLAICDGTAAASAPIVQAFCTLNANTWRSSCTPPRPPARSSRSPTRFTELWSPSLRMHAPLAPTMVTSGCSGASTPAPRRRNWASPLYTTGSRLFALLHLLFQHRGGDSQNTHTALRRRPAFRRCCPPAARTQGLDLTRGGSPPSRPKKSNNWCAIVEKMARSSNFQFN